MLSFLCSLYFYCTLSEMTTIKMINLKSFSSSSSSSSSSSLSSKYKWNGGNDTPPYITKIFETLHLIRISDKIYPTSIHQLFGISRHTNLHQNSLVLIIAYETTSFGDVEINEFSKYLLFQIKCWYLIVFTYSLSHWSRVTHICVGNLTIIGSDNGLSPVRPQAIIWTSAGILLVGPLGTNFSEILIGVQIFSFTKMHLRMSSTNWRPFCPGINVLLGTSSGGSYVKMSRSPCSNSPRTR